MSSPGDPARGETRRVGAAVLALLAAVGGAIVALRPRARPRPVAAPVAPPPGELPRDPLAYVPASAQTVALVDLARLREAPATRGCFVADPGDSCQEAIARRVRTVALVVPRLPPDDFAFVAAGDLAPADLARCAPRAEPLRREGFSLMAVRSQRDGGPGGLVAWTPEGVVLVGAAPVVEAMLDRAVDVARARAPRALFEAHRGLVRADAALWAIHLGDRAAPPDDPLATVSAGVLSLTLTDGLRAEAILRCDDPAHAARVEATLARVRLAMADALTEPRLRAAVTAATLASEGPDLRVRAALPPADVAALAATASGLARGLARGLAAP